MRRYPTHRTFHRALAALFLIPILLPGAIMAAPGDVLFTIGSSSPEAGSAPGAFYYPLDIALDATGNIFVVDNQNGRVQVFNPDGAFLRMFGTRGYSDEGGYLAQPQGIGIDRKGVVYVSDPGNRNIQMFSADGVFLDFLATFGFDPGQVYWPLHYAFDDRGNLHVTDFKHGAIQVFDRHGRPAGAIGEPGLEDGQFMGLYGVAIDAAGNLYAGDNDEIQVFNPEGNYVRSWGSFGTEPGQFRYTDGLVLDGGGRLFVADSFNHRLQVFDTAGNLLEIWGEEGQAPGQFTVPTGLALDEARNRLYVADMWNHRVQVIEAFGATGGPGDFAGFLPPVSLQKPVKAGSVLPVKFALEGGGDAGTATLSVACGQAPYEAIPAGRSSRGNRFRYDGGSGQYVFNLATGHLPAGMCTLTVTLADGQAYAAPVYLE